MPPVAIVAAASAGAGIAGGIIQGNAARDAADKQSSAADRANQLQYQMFQQQQNSQQPWRQAGISALYGTGGLFKRKDGGPGVTYDQSAVDAKKQAFMQDRMNQFDQGEGSNLSKMAGWLRFTGADPDALMANAKAKAQADAEAAWSQSPDSQFNVDSSQYELDPELTRSFTNDDFVKDPGYDFRMQEGQKALERSAAAKGGLASGGFAKGLTQYSQNFASNEFQNAANRFNNDRANRIGLLSSISGIGQNATNQNSAAGQNYANQAANNITGSASAQGAAGIAGANGWASALGNIGNNAMGAYSISQFGGKTAKPTWMDQSTSAMGSNVSGSPLSGYNYNQSPQNFWR